MATKGPSKPHRTPLQEASDPATDPERLRQLAQNEGEVVQRVAWRNPSLPEEVWREALLEGHPEAWANPMAPIYVMTWTPRKDDPNSLDQSAPWATYALWRNPKRCSPEGKAMMAAKVQEWWATSLSTSDMMSFLGGWAKMKGEGSVEHRKVVRILVLCVRMAPDLTDDDRQVLDLLEAWSDGVEDRRKEGYDVASSQAVMNTVEFAQDSSISPWFTIDYLLRAVASPKEVDHLLTDLIRREMPLTPPID